jgi:hypothetical protein
VQLANVSILTRATRDVEAGLSLQQLPSVPPGASSGGCSVGDDVPVDPHDGVPTSDLELLRVKSHVPYFHDVALWMRTGATMGARRAAQDEEPECRECSNSRSSSQARHRFGHLPATN